MTFDAPTFDRDARELAKDAIAFYSRYANPLLLDALIDAARWAVEVTEGDGIWWCEKHRSRFLEKQPSERSLCLYSLYEDNFIAVGWEDCVPVRARVVIRKGAEMTRVDRLREDGWTECGTCGGSEQAPIPVPEKYQHLEDKGYKVSATAPCPVCVAGRVPPDGMVEAAAKAMEPLAPNAPLRWYAMARAALVAAARWEAPGE